MFGQKFFPYSTLQELNLDWILTKVKNILRFVPDDGAVGQILRRTRDGAEWSNETGGGGAVDSVNGQTGTVVLTASDVGALPDSYTAPVSSVNTKTGAVVLDKTDVGLGNVANVAQYSASNPPPYPVTSVNGQTGAVSVSVPTKTSDLNNDSGFVTSAQAAAAAPVQSVNGQTGAVTIHDYIIDSDTFTVSSATTGDKSGSVTFNKTFSAAPIVFCVWNERNNGNYFNGGIKVSSVTATGFSYVVNVKNTYNTSWAVRWVAISL